MADIKAQIIPVQTQYKLSYDSSCKTKLFENLKSYQEEKKKRHVWGETQILYDQLQHHVYDLRLCLLSLSPSDTLQKNLKKKKTPQNQIIYELRKSSE